MNLEINEENFGDLYPYVADDNVTDLKWNGRQLWIDDLTKGRYLSDVQLTEDFLKIFTGKVAHMVNVNFSPSASSLQAETDELRLHAIHPFRTGDHTYILAIRKTPAKARINNNNIIQSGYSDELFVKFIGAAVRAHCSGLIIGDVGAGKTELEKYIASYIPANESCMTIEDTLEMKLPVLYPEKDISSVKISNGYDTVQAIRDALRLLIKWLIIAEARGREISTIIEGASTGCVAWSTIHANNVWEIIDRIVQMSGKDADKEGLENDVYTFFDMGIKVSKKVTDHGITRHIDQICFFDRKDKVNSTVLFMKDGKYTGNKIPQSLLERFEENEEDELISLLKENNLC